MLAQSEAGTAVFLVSEDLEELITVADKIAVMFEGKIMGIVPSSEADTEKLGMMMAGVKLEESTA